MVCVAAELLLVLVVVGLRSQTSDRSLSFALMLGWRAGDISGVVRVVDRDDWEFVEGVDGDMADSAAESDRFMFCGDVNAYFVNKKLN
jgi:hypothetical protein